MIDFKALESRKQREYDKLERMIKYAQSTKCRRSYILGYFGDHDAAECGRCDNCGPIEAGGQAAGSADRHRGRPRGRAQGSLGRGPGQGEVRQDGRRPDAHRLEVREDGPLGLNRLSTFGILADFAQSEVAG